jgi:hypothetical protein
MKGGFYRLTVGLFCLLVSSPLFAVRIDIEDPCTGKIAASSYQIEGEGVSLGELSIRALEGLALPYLGSDAGINSIFNTPTGLDAMEVLSDTDMRAYGWCYLVDGELVDRYANDIPSKGIDTVTWFYGYALMENATWVSMCEKISYSEQGANPFFCPLK